MPVVGTEKMTSSRAKSVSFFKGISLFAGMPDDVIESYARIATMKTYKKGQLLYDGCSIWAAHRKCKAVFSEIIF